MARPPPQASMGFSIEEALEQLRAWPDGATLNDWRILTGEISGGGSPPQAKLRVHMEAPPETSSLGVTYEATLHFLLDPQTGAPTGEDQAAARIGRLTVALKEAVRKAESSAHVARFVGSHRGCRATFDHASGLGAPRLLYRGEEPPDGDPWETHHWEPPRDPHDQPRGDEAS